MTLEKLLGFRSSFNFVPLRYNVSKGLLEQLCKSGFEIGLHGLHHDGKLYKSRTIFRERAKIINEYLRQWDCVGFRSPSMHHNLEWLHELNILYDSSTFDTDPFEPQPTGVGTIFPFDVCHDGGNKGYVELPYTIPQDFTLFILMKEPNIKIWKRKLDWIADNGGMALLNTHPDYMNFKHDKMTIDEYPSRHYSNFLEYVRTNYEGKYWHVLPRDIASFWTERRVAG
jgi:peptidoglycan/xylan/chitin deacetylase (PgdA/CDA1 family)